MTDLEVIKGPAPSIGAGGIIYQVTLAQGLVLTNPSAFGDIEYAGPTWPGGPVLAEDGTLLAPDAPKS